MTKKMTGLSIELLSHPGETLKELLESKEMSQLELAARIDVTPKHINQIIKGKKSITSNMALKLSNVFSLKAGFWNNLQMIYDEQREEIINIEKITQEEKEIVKKAPTQDLIKWNYIKENPQTIEENVLFYRSFVGVSSLTNCSQTIESIQFRKSESLNMNPFLLAIWLKMCELETQNKEVEEINIQKLKELLPEIKSLINEDINEAIEKLSTLLASCGIAFAVIHNLKGAPVQGIVKYTSNKILLCLTIRQKYADIFWFSLFHEIGHIINGRSEKTYVNFDNSEEKSDNYSSNFLINKKEYEIFLKENNFSLNSIFKFAQKNNINEGIVIGRLLHDKIITYTDNLCKHRIKFSWDE